VTLYDGQRIPGHSFWFNMKFIKDLIKDFLN